MSMYAFLLLIKGKNQRRIQRIQFGFFGPESILHPDEVYRCSAPEHHSIFGSAGLLGDALELISKGHTLQLLTVACFAERTRSSCLFHVAAFLNLSDTPNGESGGIRKLDFVVIRETSDADEHRLWEFATEDIRHWFTYIEKTAEAIFTRSVIRYTARCRSKGASKAQEKDVKITSLFPRPQLSSDEGQSS